MRIVILGGGTAGWMTAAGLSHFLQDSDAQIHLIESDKVGTVGVGEATLPHLKFFNQTIGIDEQEFMRATNATIKLGIEFNNWGQIGQSYIHPFGEYGPSTTPIKFHHIWHRLLEKHPDLSLQNFSAGEMMARNFKFQIPQLPDDDVSTTYSYAYHIDAGRYAKFLRDISTKKGVTRQEGLVENVSLDPESGNILFLRLEDGDTISGDLFIDCSGFRSVLLGQALGEAYEDWSHYLPCDRAIAIPSTHTTPEKLPPYTQAEAHGHGWTWKIPLQHRNGNGSVYCSEYTSDDKIEALLMRKLGTTALASPNKIRFKAGLRRKQWKKNCIGVGLSAGFLEPLESTSIYLIQAAITTLVELLPNKRIDPVDIKEFNDVINVEYERIRDFLILHYVATERNDTEFWRYIQNMPLPHSLIEKISMFKSQGFVPEYKDGLFLFPSWLSVFIGQGIIPQNRDPRADALSQADLDRHLNYANTVRKFVDSSETHTEFLNKYCRQGMS
ncbi:tryptophan halogenase family protein [Hirschia litorea]|uniref:Tryptophan halogenase family protein n=1 Tax=Hirschia litorea TaxID=1199156 RepID=A0ABW2INS8_9PROT